MAAFSHINGAEPSTVTFKLATITQTRNSSAMHQEIMALGDPDSSLAIAAVVNAVPASTVWALAIRQVGNSSIQGNSTVVQGTSPWIVSGASTVAPLAGSTWATRPIQSSAADLQMTATQGTSPWVVSGASTVAQASTVWAVQLTQYSTIVAVSSISGVVSMQGNSTVVQGTSPWVVSGASTVAQASTVWAVQLSQYSTVAAISSVSGVVTIAGNSTVNIGSHIQSSGAPSSGSSGIMTREIIDIILTTGSTDAFGAGSTAFAIQSSGAAIRSYVTAYSILTTNAGPTKVAFFSSGTMLWPLVLAAVSSAVTGANLAVSAPAYLFRTTASEALTLRTKSSSIAGWHAAVSYFRAP